MAIALIYYVLIVIFGPVSGGHFNPAITFGLFIKEALRSNQKGEKRRKNCWNIFFFCMLIIFCQYVGGYIG